jgi:pimeloyl-ACP methyl ester carboxylesterase
MVPAPLSAPVEPEPRKIEVTATITRRRAMGLMAAAPALLSKRSSAAAGAIDETGFARIGGIEQWVAIQGRDIRNPAILYLHGGPGEAQSPFLREFVPWETDFTVVNWDQRGSGRTYGKNGPATPGMSTPQMALDQLTQDAREVVEYACKRLSRKKIILAGQSWGAELGLHVVKRWPELFHAFVGTGQPVSWHLKIESQERWAREQATAAGDQETLKALSDTASLPESDQRRIRASAKYRLAPSDLEHVKVFTAFLGPPPLPTHGDAADWIAGGRFTSEKLAPIEYSLDARKLGLDFSIPFFVIQGRDDHIAPFEVARAYVAEVRAPKKAFIPIAGGHWACFTNATAFVAALRQHVRPLADG